MNINATLVVQGLNFLCAYFLLKKLFFKPVVVVLDKEQLVQDGLITAINESKNALDEQMKKKQQTWRAHQEHFKKEMPNVQSVRFFITDTVEHVPEINPKNLEKVVVQTEQLIVQKVSNVS